MKIAVISITQQNSSVTTRTTSACGNQISVNGDTRSVNNTMDKNTITIIAAHKTTAIKTIAASNPNVISHEAVCLLNLNQYKLLRLQT